ncbi:MAG TPA: Lrp/AsnC family transcriptional regulator [Candidatus Nanoarchaeia archaeon]|nr:Lrp/AsnC family transcriptional regulator [Candidatus Nanoarchaeia archaeon]
MIKQADLKFLSYLRKNSRQTLTEISKKTKIPISTLYDKLRLHERSTILKHTSLIDFAKLGFNCRADILFKVNKEERDKLGSYLKAHPAINNLFKINNGYDFLAEGIFCHVKDLEDFLDELEKSFGVEDKQTHYIIEDLKREEFLPEAAT